VLGASGERQSQLRRAKSIDALPNFRCREPLVTRAAFLLAPVTSKVDSRVAYADSSTNSFIPAPPVLQTSCVPAFLVVFSRRGKRRRSRDGFGPGGSRGRTCSRGSGCRGRRSCRSGSAFSTISPLPHSAQGTPEGLCAAGAGPVLRRLPGTKSPVLHLLRDRQVFGDLEFGPLSHAARKLVEVVFGR